jgi:hypothetical protein
MRLVWRFLKESIRCWIRPRSFWFFSNHFRAGTLESGWWRLEAIQQQVKRASLSACSSVLSKEHYRRTRPPPPRQQSNNVIANLELMPRRMKERKNAHAGQRQRDLVQKLFEAGL